VGIPFQLAGTALGGPLKLGDDEFSVSLFAPPLFVTAIAVPRREPAVSDDQQSDRLLSDGQGTTFQVVTTIFPRACSTSRWRIAAGASASG
jgi:hypothetical protein